MPRARRRSRPARRSSFRRPGRRWPPWRPLLAARACTSACTTRSMCSSARASARPSPGRSAGGGRGWLRAMPWTPPLAALERRGLVHGLAAALLAADEVLRVLRGSLDRAAARLGVGGDLALDHAGCVIPAVGAPHDLVALLELVSHAPGLPGPSGYSPM